jgi:hypothetical protein
MFDAAGVPSAAKSGTWSKAQLLPADVAPKEWDNPATLKVRLPTGIK